MGRTTHSVLDMIGNTPLLGLSADWTSNGSRILAKLEGANPTGSLKDRIAKYMIEDAEVRGTLQPHHIIVEGSSGNTGISLGMVCKLKGYRCQIFMPESKSVERRVLIRAWGAELVLTDGTDPYSHINLATEAGEKHPEKYFFIDQNGNHANALAHYHGTGSEIVDQVEGKVDAVVAGIGTGGTIMGVGRRIKERWPDAKVYQVEPSQPISRIEGLIHLEEGAFRPGILDMSIVDEVLYVEDEAALESCRLLTERDGLFCGISSGAVLSAAARIGRESPDTTVVVVLGDRGERYLSTVLCAPYRDD